MEEPPILTLHLVTNSSGVVVGHVRGKGSSQTRELQIYGDKFFSSRSPYGVVKDHINLGQPWRALLHKNNIHVWPCFVRGELVINMENLRMTYDSPTELNRSRRVDPLFSMGNDLFSASVVYMGNSHDISEADKICWTSFEDGGDKQTSQWFSSRGLQDLRCHTVLSDDLVVNHGINGAVMSTRKEGPVTSLLEHHSGFVSSGCLAACRDLVLFRSYSSFSPLIEEATGQVLSLLRGKFYAMDIPHIGTKTHLRMGSHHPCARTVLISTTNIQASPNSKRKDCSIATLFDVRRGESVITDSTAEDYAPLVLGGVNSILSSKKGVASAMI